MKTFKIVGNVCLIVASSWALLVTKSDYYYDKLAYSFFLSSGISGVFAAAIDDDQVEKHAELGTSRSHMFSTSLLTTEICLTAGMDNVLAFSNLLLPVVHLVNRKSCNWEKIVSSSLWYSTVLLAMACHSLDVNLGYLLTLSLVLGSPKSTKYYPFLMGLSVILGRLTLSQLKEVV